MKKELEINTVDYTQEEVWLPVVGYEGLYEVSSFGNIKSIDRFIERDCYGGKDKKVRVNVFYPEKILKGNENRYGYNTAHLCDKYKNRKRPTIHRIVAKAFILNPENKPCVNHKDGNKINNIVDNLEWCTYSENSQHSIDMKLRQVPLGVDHGMAKLNESDVLQIRELAKQGFYQKEIAIMYNMHVGYIGAIIRRQSWKHI